MVTASSAVHNRALLHAESGGRLCRVGLVGKWSSLSGSIPGSTSRTHKKKRFFR